MNIILHDYFEYYCHTPPRFIYDQRDFYEDFYLSTARLDPLKRVDLVVKAFLDMPEKKLKVISGGPDMPKIKKLAQGAENIQALGWVDEKRMSLSTKYERCLLDSARRKKKDVRREIVDLSLSIRIT